MTAFASYPTVASWCGGTGCEVSTHYSLGQRNFVSNLAGADEGGVAAAEVGDDVDLTTGKDLDSGRPGSGDAEEGVANQGTVGGVGDRQHGSGGSGGGVSDHASPLH